MTQETISLLRTAVEQAKTLYEITGDIKDINTLLIPRSAIVKPLQMEATDEFYAWWGSHPLLAKNAALREFYESIQNQEKS